MLANLSATDSCTITRRVEVQRWPAVPTAPKKIELHRHVEIGAGRDDQRVIAAEFHDRFAKATVNSFRHVETHSRRAGGGNQRNPPIVRQAFGRLFCRSPMSSVKIAGSAPVSRQTRSAIWSRRSR